MKCLSGNDSVDPLRLDVVVLLRNVTDRPTRRPACSTLVSALFRHSGTLQHVSLRRYRHTLRQVSHRRGAERRLPAESARPAEGGTDGEFLRDG